MVEDARPGRRGGTQGGGVIDDAVPCSLFCCWSSSLLFFIIYGEARYRHAEAFLYHFLQQEKILQLILTNSDAFSNSYSYFTKLGKTVNFYLNECTSLFYNFHVRY